MADRVELVASASFTALQNEVSRQGKKIEELENRIRRLSGAYDENERRGKRAFSSLIARAAQVATTYFGIHQAINLVSSAFSELIQKADQARRSSMDVAQAESEVFLPATSQLSDLQRAVLRRGAARLMPELSEAQRIQIAANVFSATSPGPPVPGRPEAAQQVRIDKTLEIIAGANLQMRSALAANPQIAESIQDLTRTTGDTPRQAVDFIQRLLSITRVGDPENIDKLVRGIASGVESLNLDDQMARWLSSRQVGAFMASVGSTIGESQGTMTATAAGNFPEHISRKLREGGISTKGLTFDELIALAMEKGMTGDAIEFLGKSFAMKGKGATRILSQQVFKPGSQIDLARRAALEAFLAPDPDALERQARQAAGTAQFQEPDVFQRNVMLRTQFAGEETRRRQMRMQGFVRGLLLGEGEKPGALEISDEPMRSFFQRQLTKAALTFPGEDIAQFGLRELTATALRRISERQPGLLAPFAGQQGPLNRAQQSQLAALAGEVTSKDTQELLIALRDLIQFLELQRQAERDQSVVERAVQEQLQKTMAKTFTDAVNSVNANNRQNGPRE